MRIYARALPLIAAGAALSLTWADRPRVAADSPAVSVVALDVFAQPTAIDMLTAVEQGKAIELYHQRSIDGGASWSTRGRVERGGKALAGAHRGMDPQIAAVGDTLLAMWTTPGSDRWGDGPLATSISRDGGRTWTPGPNPADDGSAHGHSFLELSADGRGRLHAFWLDSRDGGQGLRTSVSADQGRTWAKNIDIDTRTCECCWNKALAAGTDSMFLLYRDKDPRDMALAVTLDGGRTWSRRATVGAFNWGFNGCPHVGGGLAATDVNGSRVLHAMVWTGAVGVQGLHVLRSVDDGRTWSRPQHVGGAYARHADLTAVDRAVYAVWDESGNGRTAILAARSSDQGATWDAPTTLSTVKQASHPLLATSRGQVTAFWTEQTAHGELTWRSARLSAAAGATSTRAQIGGRQ